METVMMITIVGLLVEAIVETLRMIYDEKTRKFSIPIVLSLIVGLGIAFGANLSLFKAFPEFSTAPDWLGCILTGILVSRGSNFIHDLWARINATKTN